MRTMSLLLSSSIPRIFLPSLKMFLPNHRLDTGAMMSKKEMKRSKIPRIDPLAPGMFGPPPSPSPSPAFPILFFVLMRPKHKAATAKDTAERRRKG